MLQEMMLGEEYQMIAGTCAPIGTPSAPACVVRAAGSNETAFNTTITTIYTVATNYFGTTAASAGTSVSISSGQVVDVTNVPLAGAMQYQIWGYDGTSHYLLATCGGIRYTLQGYASLPTPASMPNADSGTGKGTRIEGVIPTLTGASANAGIYPEGWQGGYVNLGVGTHLSIPAVNTALKALWDSSTGSTTNGPFKADPAELVSSGTDIANLANDITSAGAGNNYLITVPMGAGTGNMEAGAAVTQFRNPITQSIVKLVVHPWYTQGSATLLSYQLPQTWTNVSNAIEFQAVQDYVSISWPTIDATFRYSIFALGALVMHAPQYSAHLAGLQASDTAPYS